MVAFIVEFLRMKMKFSILNCYAVSELGEEKLRLERNFKYLSIPSLHISK
jgi:hypothetical protein